MTRWDAMKKYSADCTAYATWRKRCDDPEGADFWIERAQQTERLLLTEKHEQDLAALRRTAEQQIDAALDVAADNFANLRTWSIERSKQVEKEFLDESARTRRDQRNRESASTVQKIAKSSVTLGKKVFHDEKGRIQRVEIQEDGLTVRTKYPVYDAKSRIVEVREEKNPYVRAAEQE